LENAHLLPQREENQVRRNILVEQYTPLTTKSITGFPIVVAFT
jgi:hypothetical protein